jgi:nucleotide-binding universal stress UspA family protein
VTFVPGGSHLVPCRREGRRTILEVNRVTSRRTDCEEGVMTESSRTAVATAKGCEARRAYVVVGVDGSPDSDRAIRFAVGEAQRRDVGLRLVHVQAEPFVWPPLPAALPATTLHGIAAAIVKGAEQQARSFGWSGSEIDVVLSYGPRRDAILEHTDDAELLVVGRRSSAADHVLTGSTSSSLAAHADVPVISVPEGWDAVDRHGLLVTGVDVCGGDEAREVVSAAYAAAKARNSRIELLHAWRPEGAYDVAIGSRVLEDRWAEGVRRHLVDQALATPGNDDVAWSVSAAYERPALALFEASGRADLVVVGRHGHRSRVHRSIGSTARAVLRSARCPVMVVPTVPHPQ